MESRDIKRIVLDAIARWNAHDERYFESYTADAPVHGLPPDAPPTLEGLKGMFRAMWIAFPDVVATPLHVIVEDELCAVNLRVTGTHSSEFLGVPATGTAIDVHALVFLRFDADGRVAERWQRLDDVALLRQIGAMPGPAGT
jgi:predicted ester cyclase